MLRNVLLRVAYDTVKVCARTSRLRMVFMAALVVVTSFDSNVAEQWSVVACKSNFRILHKICKFLGACRPIILAQKPKPTW